MTTHDTWQLNPYKMYRLIDVILDTHRVILSTQNIRFHRNVIKINKRVIDVL